MPPPLQQAKPWSWVTSLLATDATDHNEDNPSSASTSTSSRCKIRILDIAFISPASSKSSSSSSSSPPKPSTSTHRNSISIDSWLYTSKKGEVTKKKRENLSLSKVYDRFSRFSLANPSNLNGPKHVCVVYPRGGVQGNRRLMNHGELQGCTESNDSEGCEELVGCASMQCYLRDFGGKDEVWRGSYRHDKNHNKNTIDIKIIKKPFTYTPTTSQKDKEESIKPNNVNNEITTEMKTNIHTIISHINNVTAKMFYKANLQKTNANLTRVFSLSADFVLDDNRQLWLCCVDDVIMGSSDPVQPSPQLSLSLPSPQLPPTNITSLPSLTTPEIFTKKIGPNGSTLYTSSKGLHELPGLCCWREDDVDGSLNIDMRDMTEMWGLDSDTNTTNSSMPGPPQSTQELDRLKESKAKSHYKLSHKSILLAMSSIEYLTGSIRAENGPLFASKFRDYDRQNQASLSAKKGQSYYDEVTVDGNAYEICLKLDNLRRRNFDMGGSTDRPSSEPRPDSSNLSEYHNGDSNTHSRSSTAGDKNPINNKPINPNTNTTLRKSHEAFKLNEKENDSIKKVSRVYNQSDTRGKKMVKKGVNVNELNRFAENRGMEQAIEANQLGRMSAAAALKKKDDDDSKAAFEGEKRSALEGEKKRIENEIKRKRFEREERESSNSHHSPNNDGDGQMSKTERDFLSRRGNSFDVDFSQTQPTFPNHVMHQSLDNIPGFGSNNSNNNYNSNNSNEATLAALRSRITSIEKENKQLLTKLTSAEESAISNNNRAKEATKKLNTNTHKFNKSMQEKDDTNYKNVLEVESNLNLSKAENAQLKSTLASFGGNQNIDNNTSYQQDLIKKIESLHNELSTNQRKWNEEKRTLLSDQANSHQNFSAKYRTEMSDQRSSIATLEDRIGEINENLRTSEKEKSIYHERLADAEKRKLIALADADKLRSDIKTLQQSLQATQSLDMAQGEMYRDGESTIAALQATSEARIRTLNNKVEYLKAQLASEASLKDQYSTTISDLRKDKEETAALTKSKMQELSSLKEKEITEAQEYLRESMDGPIQEVSHLQGKVAALQAQLGDAMQDIAQSRKKEEAARGETSKEKSRISSVQHELNMANNELVNTKEEITILKENSSNAAANEAMLRRLDNERQYLKNQLTSEVTCKNELQETLEKTTRQLGEMKAAWQAESGSLSQKIMNEGNRRDAIETELSTTNQSLKAEVKTQSTQLTEMKDAYVKTRDQLRLDQASVENMRATASRLAEELRGAQDELVNARRAADDTNSRHSQNMRTISATVAQAEDARRKETERLQTECRNALQKTSETQRAMMELKEQLLVNQTAALKVRGAQFVATIFTKWLNGCQARAFSTWMKSVNLKRAAEDTRKQVKQAVQLVEEKAKDEREMACRIVMGKMAAEKEEAIKKMEASSSEDRRKLVKAAQDDITRAVENEMKRSNSVLKEKQLKSESHLASIIANHKNAIVDMSRAHEEHQNSIKAGLDKDISRAVFEAEKDFLANQSETLKSSDGKWKALMDENEKRLEGEKTFALEKQLAQQDKLLDSHTSRMESEKDALLQTFKRDVDAAVKVEEERMKDALEKAVHSQSVKDEQLLKSEIERMNDVIKDIHEQNLATLEVEKGKWNESLDALKEGWEQDIDAQYAEKIRMVGEKEKDQRQKAVRLEAGKWQKALRETEDRIEAERIASFKKGVAERDNTAQKDMAELKSAANQALDKVKASAKDSLKQALGESAAQLKLAREHAMKEKDNAIKKGMESANKDKIAAVDDALSVLSKAAEKKRAEAVASAVAREQMSTARIQGELDNVNASWRKDHSDLIEHKEMLKESMMSSQTELKNHFSAAEDAAYKSSKQYEFSLSAALKSKEEEMEKIRVAEQLKNAEHYASEREKAVKEAQTVAEKDMDAALEALEAESEKLISSLEQAMTGLRRSKAETEAELTNTKAMLEENEDTIYDLQTLAKSKAKENSFSLLQLATGGVRQRIKHLKEFEAERKEVGNNLSYMKNEAQSADDKRVKEIRVLDSILDACKQQRELMHETLVNHKRETLVEHKVQSGVISRELEALALERDAVEGQREVIEMQLKVMEDTLKDLEEQINNHSKTSTIQGGRVNVSHARKKRRLDEEFEQLLENIENKREEGSVVDGKIKELSEQREDSEDKMKNLERMLVEVLVEQQKKLLQILATKPEEIAKQMREGKGADGERK